MWKSGFYFLCAVFLISLFITPAWSQSEKGTSGRDPCQESGIVVKNLDIKNLWYKKDDGACYLWKRDYMFTIKPGETVDICSDLTCETLYCEENPTYHTYRALDTNNNCRVRILPGCAISDM
jgi:hypothetical protein